MYAYYHYEVHKQCTHLTQLDQACGLGAGDYYSTCTHHLFQSLGKNISVKVSILELLTLGHHPKQRNLERFQTRKRCQTFSQLKRPQCGSIWQNFQPTDCSNSNDIQIEFWNYHLKAQATSIPGFVLLFDNLTKDIMLRRRVLLPQLLNCLHQQKPYLICKFKPQVGRQVGRLCLTC